MPDNRRGRGVRAIKRVLVALEQCPAVLPCPELADGRRDLLVRDVMDDSDHYVHMLKRAFAPLRIVELMANAHARQAEGDGRTRDPERLKRIVQDAVEYWPAARGVLLDATQRGLLGLSKVEGKAVWGEFFRMLPARQPDAGAREKARDDVFESSVSPSTGYLYDAVADAVGASCGLLTLGLVRPGQLSDHIRNGLRNRKLRRALG